MTKKAVIIETNLWVSHHLARTVTAIGCQPVATRWIGFEITLQQVKYLAPEVVIMNSEIVGSEAQKFIALLKEAAPKLFMIVLDLQGTCPSSALITAGADYVIDTPNDFLWAQLLQERFRGPQDSALRRFSDPLDARESPLSNREWEVLAHLADGKLYKEVAASLSICTETVKSDVKNICRKTRSRNRSHAVARFASGSLAPEHIKPPQHFAPPVPVS